MREVGPESALGPYPVCGLPIKARGSQAHGEAKTKTADLVEVLFGFKTGRNKDTIARNRKKYEYLKHQNGFVFQEDLTDVGGIHKGIYQHPIIQRLINKMWFKNRHNEGIEYEESFNPLPVPAIALMLTIEANIDKWATGIQTDVSFYTDDYRPVYLEHITTLLAFGEHTHKHDLLGRLQCKVYNYGCLHAGAPAAALKNMSTVPISAFADAIKEYEDNSETDDEGDMMYA
ncbi:hypothetical protein K443DRAFT_13365 [Laccaria amethystina LaAM-08-1]|uniref:DUF6532 domain-containing protein n=1 Tax=Laccaria amethystina LaAM-08-1 TaxID=1095629 RepID=A0A0C9X527_9AGAR|nr:hypothetical protein K443DRAFT_13365 [Laccaria amethystina LaAM-08-1]